MFIQLQSLLHYESLFQSYLMLINKNKSLLIIVLNQCLINAPFLLVKYLLKQLKHIY